MDTINDYKRFYRDKSIEELNYDAQIWKSQLDFLKYEFDFLKTILDSNIYEPEIINLFETLQLHKEGLSKMDRARLKLMDKLELHINVISKKIECDEMSCDSFFMDMHEKKSNETALFIKESNSLMIQLFQYIESVLKK